MGRYPALACSRCASCHGLRSLLRSGSLDAAAYRHSLLRPLLDTTQQIAIAVAMATINRHSLVLRKDYDTPHSSCSCLSQQTTTK